MQTDASGCSYGCCDSGATASNFSELTWTMMETGHSGYSCHRSTYIPGELDISTGSATLKIMASVGHLWSCRGYYVLTIFPAPQVDIARYLYLCQPQLHLDATTTGASGYLGLQEARRPCNFRRLNGSESQPGHTESLLQLMDAKIPMKLSSLFKIVPGINELQWSQSCCIP